jgi:hypothetical protein
MEQSCTGASMGMCGDGVNRVRVGSTPHRGKGRLGHVCSVPSTRVHSLKGSGFL